MATGIPLVNPLTVAELGGLPEDGTHHVAPDLAYRRLGIVNVVFYGPPGAGDREWVLIDAGVMGTTGLIEDARRRASARAPARGHRHDARPLRPRRRPA